MLSRERCPSRAAKHCVPRDKDRINIKLIALSTTTSNNPSIPPHLSEISRNYFQYSRAKTAAGRRPRALIWDLGTRFRVGATPCHQSASFVPDNLVYLTAPQGRFASWAHTRRSRAGGSGRQGGDRRGEQLRRDRSSPSRSDRALPSCCVQARVAQGGTALPRSEDARAPRHVRNRPR